MQWLCIFLAYLHRELARAYNCNCSLLSNLALEIVHVFKISLVSTLRMRLIHTIQCPHRCTLKLINLIFLGEHAPRSPSLSMWLLATISPINLARNQSNNKLTVDHIVCNYSFSISLYIPSWYWSIQQCSADGLDCSETGVMISCRFNTVVLVCIRLIFFKAATPL